MLFRSACGGTHRLFGLTWAYFLHRQRGGKKAGIWKDLADKLEHYQQVAKKTQNADGSFSTDYLKGPGNNRDPQTRIGTTGHILEWLALYLADDELKAGWIQEAAGSLSLMILGSHDRDIEGGALYHATHGLHLYHARTYGDPKAKSPVPSPPRD